MAHELDHVHRMYRRALGALRDSGIPFLVGGAYALGVHTRIHRETKDLDLFTLPGRAPEILKRLEETGLPSRMVAEHWLGKATFDGAVIDVIFGFRNGMGRLDESWFANATDAVLFGIPVKVLAPEEMIWSKAFVMERDRYDGADIAHLLRANAERMDWYRLLDRFGDFWPLLLNSLVLFSFIYPADRSKIPDWLAQDLTQRWLRQADRPGARLCQGTLLSSLQYLHDLNHHGMVDARIRPIGSLTAEHVDD